MLKKYTIFDIENKIVLGKKWIFGDIQKKLLITYKFLWKNPTLKNMEKWEKSNVDLVYQIMSCLDNVVFVRRCDFQQVNDYIKQELDKNKGE